MRNSIRFILWALLVGVVATIIFWSFPRLDPWVTSFNYTEEYGFALSLAPMFEPTSWLASRMLFVIGIVSLGLLAWKTAFPSRPGPGPNRIVLLFIAASVALGPGLVVNTLLKDNWGRARPSHTREFNGPKTYSLPLVISDQCRNNCSFVAGDAAAGFWLAALALAFPGRARRWIITGLAAGLVFGAIRIGQGGHYLSDVVFSGVFTFISIGLAWELVVVRAVYRRAWWARQRERVARVVKGVRRVFTP